MLIDWIGSPSRTKGREGLCPEALVIHVMDGTLAGTDSWFQNQASSVSAHYGLGQAGEIHQYVGELDTALHAGRQYRASWHPIRPGIKPNRYSVGIEHKGEADPPWTEGMLSASARLAADLHNRWCIACDGENLIGHREIRARKSCSGNWINLRNPVQRVHFVILDPATYNRVDRGGSVAARVNLNIWQGGPTTLASVVRTAPAESTLPYVGRTSNGLAVNGNAHWYKDVNDGFFGAGGADKPTPDLL